MRGTNHAPHADTAVRDDTFAFENKTEFLVEWHILRVHGFQVTWQIRGISACQSGAQQCASDALSLAHWINSQHPEIPMRLRYTTVMHTLHVGFRVIKAALRRQTHLERGCQGANAQETTHAYSGMRSEEHTSELHPPHHLVSRLLL